MAKALLSLCLVATAFPAMAAMQQPDVMREQALKVREAKIAKLLRKRDRYARNCPESETACVKASEMEARIQEERTRPLLLAL